MQEDTYTNYLFEYCSSLKYSPKNLKAAVTNRKASSFLLIVSGEYQYSMPDSTFIAKSGTLVYLPYGSCYTFQVLSNPSETSCLQLDFSLRKRNTNDFYNIAEKPKILIQHTPPEIYEVMDNIVYTAIDMNLSNGFKINAYMNMLYGLILENLQKSQSSKGLRKILPAITYIEKHLDKKIKISELAEQCYLSIAQFRRIFTKEKKMSPNQYITALKIQKACNLLKNTDLSISEIAFALGYDNVYYFSTSFKNVTGCSPNHFRSNDINLQISSQ